MAHKKESFIKCTICGASLKSAKLLQHKARVHSELLTDEEKALLSPKKPAVVSKRDLPGTFASWYAESRNRYISEKRSLNGTVEHAVWSCIASALFEAASEIDAQKIDYESAELKAKILELLDKFRAASRKRLDRARAEDPRDGDRAQLRGDLEVAKRAFMLAEMLSFKDICSGVASYLEGDVLYPEGLEAAYRKALLINPYNVAARGNLADLLEREGRTREAEREYENLLKYR